MPSVRIVRVEEEGPPRVEWVALILALVLGAGGLFVLRPGGPPSPATDTGALPGAPGRGMAPDRDALLWEIAALDEEFEARATYSDAERQAYARRRAELLRRIRALR